MIRYPVIRRGVELFLLLLAAPFALFLGGFAALAVVQIRPGKNGRPFRMFKFRTMTSSRNEPFRLTDAQDTRLTSVGSWMRKLHLDEIPQLWHVLTGEMSLIGPRPVPMELYEDFLRQIPNYDQRHAIAPGITGLAQVCLGYVNTLEGERQKCAFDLYYIENQGSGLDLWILWATIAKIVGLKIDREKWETRVLNKKSAT
jgi:lipopolysaccharide/colanic/teichoic acid biosynthesis glycosyltransferase